MIIRILVYKSSYIFYEKEANSGFKTYQFGIKLRSELVKFLRLGSLNV